MIKLNLQIILAMMIPAVGATGYIHGTFVTKERFVEKVKEIEANADAIHGTFKVVCMMAIKLKLDDADEICTKQ